MILGAIFFTLVYHFYEIYFFYKKSKTMRSHKPIESQNVVHPYLHSRSHIR